MLTLVQVDWRSPGEFSAVGQLTKTIFDRLRGLNIWTIQTKTGAQSATLGRYAPHREDIGTFLPDALINRLKRVNPDFFYFRISPHVESLELALRMRLSIPNAKFIVHYMDKPKLSHLHYTRQQRVLTLYDYFLSRCDRLYVIDRRFMDEISRELGREVRALGNFVDCDNSNTAIQASLDVPLDKRMVIGYFGSLDREMNALAIEEVTEVVATMPWLELRVFSNSGLFGRVKECVDNSVSNISVYRSNLSEQEYQSALGECDLLLLPYNEKADGALDLSHSFSNKVIDYVAAGKIILSYGPKYVPSLAYCREADVGFAVESKKELRELLSDPTRFRQRLSIAYKNLGKNAHSLLTERLGDFLGFETWIMENGHRSMAVREHAASVSGKIAPRQSSDSVDQLLRFLIRRKFLDSQIGFQSISASVCAYLLKKRGYYGFDYEI